MSLRQDEMQNGTGIKAATWSNYELGKTEPSIDVLIIISKFLKVNLSDLIETDLSQKGNLNQKKGDQEKQEKGNLNSNPIGNLNDQNKLGYLNLNTLEMALQDALNEVEVPYQTTQQQMEELTSKVAKIEAFISKVSREMEGRSKPKGKRRPKI